MDTLRLDLYLPVCQDSTHTSRRPLAVLAHGGAFIAGSKSEMASRCRQFAQRGYVAVSVGYRLGFVSDDVAWNCNINNYSCVFATDTAEWIRAYYRGIQDFKGAIRYMVNRAEEYQIDPDHVFVIGESAGAFIALGAAFLDMPSEKPIETEAIADAPKPAIFPAMQSCPHNQGQAFANSIPRPDLGDINGSIEQPGAPYTIKGVGNIYGGMFNDLLALEPPGKYKAAIYQFHRPCDIIVPFQRGRVFWGYSWCLSNCFNCYGIANTPYVFGSKQFSDWNSANNYGYPVQNDFSNTFFPFNCIFGPANCAEQISNPCHALDNPDFRYMRMAEWFAPHISIPIYCVEDTLFVHTVQRPDPTLRFSLRPNPAGELLQLHNADRATLWYAIADSQGVMRLNGEIAPGSFVNLSVGHLPAGLYFAIVSDRDGGRTVKPWVRN